MLSLERFPMSMCHRAELFREPIALIKMSNGRNFIVLLPKYFFNCQTTLNFYKFTFKLPSLKWVTSFDFPLGWKVWTSFKAFDGCHEKLMTQKTLLEQEFVSLYIHNWICRNLNCFMIDSFGGLHKSFKNRWELQKPRQIWIKWFEPLENFALEDAFESQQLCCQRSRQHLFPIQK